MARDYGTLREDYTEAGNRYFVGDIRFPTLTARVRFLPLDKRTDKSPDFAVQMRGAGGDAVDIGSAWCKVSAAGLCFMSINLAQPGAVEINCAAFYNGDKADEQRDGGGFAERLPTVSGRDWRVAWSPPRRAARLPAAQSVAPLDDEIPF